MRNPQFYVSGKSPMADCVGQTALGYRNSVRQVAISVKEHDLANHSIKKYFPIYAIWQELVYKIIRQFLTFQG